jgi:hypothetical protein
VARIATVANVDDTRVFGWLFLTAFAFMGRDQAVSATKAYDAQRHRTLSQAFDPEPSSVGTG